MKKHDKKDINQDIREKGFENIEPEYQKAKAIEIWKDRKRKKQWSGLFENQDEFVKWYLKQDRECHCCHVKEEKVRKYFYGDDSRLKMTRAGKRCHMLELDKIDNFLSDEPYNENNCGLLCYVCNNAKSNFINDYESFKPIAKGIEEFWKKQK